MALDPLTALCNGLGLPSDDQPVKDTSEDIGVVVIFRTKCGCGLDDLAPCDEGPQANNCKPAYKHECPGDGECGSFLCPGHKHEFLNREKTKKEPDNMCKVKSIGFIKEEEWPVNECRFGCGSVEFELVEVPAEEGYAVECCGCGARGPIATKESDGLNAQQMAVEKWNN